MHSATTKMANNNKSHKSFFMPMLCRFSLNDTVKSTKLNNDSSTSDPSSPKLTCIGQIKKRSTTTTTTTATKSSVNSNRYTKLHKLFSGKNLISPAIDTGPINKFHTKSISKRSKSCNGRSRAPINTKKYCISGDDQDVVKVTVDEELDPPLPVVKCLRRDQESNVNLWKRRGFEMKSLQIQPIQLTLNQNPNNNNGGFSIPASASTF